MISGYIVLSFWMARENVWEVVTVSENRRTTSYLEHPTDVHRQHFHANAPFEIWTLWTEALGST